MQEERERGRIAGLKTRRLKTAAWATKLIPAFQQARLELLIRETTGEPNLSGYARWMNQHGYPAREGGDWTAEGISRVFDIQIGLIAQADKEFDIAMSIISYKQLRGNAQTRAGLQAEEQDARAQHAEAIKDARRLSAALRGREYVDEVIPEPLRFRRQAPKRVKGEQNGQDESDGQLSLF